MSAQFVLLIGQVCPNTQSPVDNFSLVGDSGSSEPHARAGKKEATIGDVVSRSS